MQVCIDARMLGARVHGLGRHVWGTVDHVARRAPEDRFLVLGDSPYARDLEEAYANVTVVPTRSRPFSLRENWDIPSTLMRLRPDLHHAVSAAIPLIRPVPYVMTIPDLIPLLFYGDQWRYRLYFKYWLPHAARRARRIIVSSEAALHDVTRHLGLSPSHVSVVPLGVETSFHPGGAPGELERLLARYGVRPPYLLTAGNPKPYKNLPRALEILDRLLPALGDDFSVVVLSSAGPLLRRALDAFRHAGRLHHVRYVEEEDLAPLYRHSHVFFYPSLYEGFGLQVLEAMACGAVVVSSSAASLREVVGDGGLLVDMSTDQAQEALQAAVTDGALRERLRTRAVARAAEFTWDRCARLTLEAYQAAL